MYIKIYMYICIYCIILHVYVYIILKPLLAFLVMCLNVSESISPNTVDNCLRAFNPSCACSGCLSTVNGPLPQSSLGL